MRENEHVIGLMERILNKTVHQFKEKKEHGGLLLSITEIHTVTAIGEHPGINLVSLAKLKGVTKGAASQMVYKLVRKNLVVKKVSEYSDKEIQLFLTTLGDTVYKGHLEYHRKHKTHICKFLDKLPDDLFKQFEKFLKEYDKSLED